MSYSALQNLCWMIAACAYLADPGNFLCPHFQTLHKS